MYRYNRQNRFNYVMKSNRFPPIILIVVILVAVFVALRLVNVGGLNEQNFENQRNARIRNEIQHAVSQNNSLSNMGATSTSVTLGRIRQYVHGVEVINDLNVSVYGEVGRLYEQSMFDNIYSIIETYDAKLATGQTVSDSQLSLREAIAELNNHTNQKVLKTE